MRLALFSLMALFAGGAGALAYSHFLGEGRALTDLQQKLATTQTDLDAARQESHQARTENDALSAQIQQLNSTKDELKKQLEEAKSSSPTVPASFGTFARGSMGDIIKSQMAQKNDERLHMLKSRLHLTPDQEATVRAAMDGESKRAEAMTSKMFSARSSIQAVSSVTRMKNRSNSLAGHPDAGTEDRLSADEDR